MKKEVKLFDKRFVHFMWDDELKGKKCFVANYIGALRSYVEKGNERYFEVERSNDADEPFQAKDGLMFSFAYYDPNYSIKKAFNEGKKVQYQLVSGIDWADIDSEEALECRITEGRTFRIKPEEEKWIAYLARPKYRDCCLTACAEGMWETVQKEFDAKTKLFVGTESEVEEWYKSRQKFAEVIKAWEDGKTIQFFNHDVDDWVDVIIIPLWKTDIIYRIKPECPCEDGIDSKACVGCEHSEDGKQFRPYESVNEFVQDFQERFRIKFNPNWSMPLIWLRNTNMKADRELVCGFREKDIMVDALYSMAELFKVWTYLDGSPCGKEC